MPCLCRNPAAKETSGYTPGKRQAEIGQNQSWITAPDDAVGIR